MTVDLKADQIRALADVGFASVFLGMTDEPEPIFDLIAQQRPDNAAGYIGQALILLYSGKFEDAIDLLEQKCLKAAANSEQGKAVHLFALFCAEEFTRARELSAGYIQSGDETLPTYNMAMALRDSLELEVSDDEGVDHPRPPVGEAAMEPSAPARQAVPGLPVGD